MNPPGRKRPTNRSSRPDYDYDAIFNEPEPPRRNAVQEAKKLVTPLRAALVIGLVILITAFLTVRAQLDPSGEQGPEVTVQVPVGATTKQITELLADQDVVPSAMAFRIWIRLKGDDQFQAGEYTFHLNSSAGAALAVLRSGPDMSTDRLVIPEGLRMDQVAERVGRLPGMTAERFRAAIASGVAQSAFQPSGASLEGFLFPDTYSVSASDTEEVLLRRMVSRFDSVARLTGLDQSSRAIQQNPYNTLIIASMIESEARLDADRGKISQVIQNRLSADMPLQIDATVIYALGAERQVVTNKDLQVNSPYNTYRNLGIPPGPISNPGQESIRAALQPEPGPWLYYVVTDANGGHSFGVTFQDHERNIALAEQRGVR